VPIGTAPRFLEAVHEIGVDAWTEAGAENVGAFQVAMVNDSECILIWALPDWPTWARAEQGWMGDGPLASWRAHAVGLEADITRTLLVDAPLSPLRTGRQPRVEDRRPLDQL
jgi:hypothetical protein